MFFITAANEALSVFDLGGKNLGLTTGISDIMLGEIKTRPLRLKNPHDAGPMMVQAMVSWMMVARCCAGVCGCANFCVWAHTGVSYCFRAGCGASYSIWASAGAGRRACANGGASSANGAIRFVYAHGGVGCGVWANSSVNCYVWTNGGAGTRA